MPELRGGLEATGGMFIAANGPLGVEGRKVAGLLGVLDIEAVLGRWTADREGFPVWSGLAAVPCCDGSNIAREGWF